MCQIWATDFGFVCAGEEIYKQMQGLQNCSFKSEGSAPTHLRLHWLIRKLYPTSLLRGNISQRTLNHRNFLFQALAQKMCQ